MALRPCIECGKDISSDAKACPYCGKSPESDFFAFKFNPAAVPGAVIALFFFLWLIWPSSPDRGKSPAPVTSIAQSLLPRQAQCQTNVSELQRLGILIRDDTGLSVAQYPELAWNAMTHDEKVRIGLLIYCAKMPADGRYSILIKGLHSGLTLGSVIDGNYLN